MARSWQQEEKLTVKEIETIMDVVLAKAQHEEQAENFGWAIQAYGAIELRTIVAKLGGMAYWLEKNGEL
jgi:hypothetical protein